MQNYSTHCESKVWVSFISSVGVSHSLEVNASCCKIISQLTKLLFIMVVTVIILCADLSRWSL